jgi:hypothetical protein
MTENKFSLMPYYHPEALAAFTGFIFRSFHGLGGWQKP